LQGFKRRFLNLNWIIATITPKQLALEQVALPRQDPSKNPSEIIELVKPKTELVAIDEIQFFDTTIVDVIKNLLDKNIDVAFSGLPSDFRGEPFGSVPVLLALSDKIVSLTAICTHKVGNKVCGQTATKTQRLIKGRPASYDSPIILVGDSESYTARCPKHHTIPNKPK